MKPYYQDDAVTIYNGDCREIKHFTYVQRLLAGKESNNKFGRYLHEFTIESALQQLA